MSDDTKGPDDRPIFGAIDELSFRCEQGEYGAAAVSGETCGRCAPCRLVDRLERFLSGYPNGEADDD